MFKLTQDQTKKGLSWLKNLWMTPKGIERKNNPFGYREENILANFKEFRLSDFYKTGRAPYYYHYPVYLVKAKDRDSFMYYVEGGEIQIVG